MLSLKNIAILGSVFAVSLAVIIVPLLLIRDKQNASDNALANLDISIDWGKYSDGDYHEETPEEFQQYYEEVSEIFESSTYSVFTSGTYTSSTTYSNSYLDASKYIASHFKLPPGQVCYSNHSSSPHNSIYGYSAHNGKTMYFTKIPMRGVSINVRHDCSGYVGAMEFYLGFTDNPLQPGNWYWYNKLVPGFKVVDAKTYADCQIGDAFHTSGHCAMIVDIRDGKAYFGDCGSCRRIEQTATRGYSYTHELTEPVSNWNSKPHIILRSERM